jgi:hypothetical protein
MSTATHSPAGATLADESFMPADDLRAYMTELEMAKASKMLGAMDQAEHARKKLVAALSGEIVVSPEKIAEIKQSLANKTRAAAGRGEKEVLSCAFRARSAPTGGARSTMLKRTGRRHSQEDHGNYEFWNDAGRDEGTRAWAAL